jgi:chromosomal replication initiator protein
MMADSQPSLLDSEESLAARRIWSRALPLLASKLTRMTYESFVMPIKPLRLVGRQLELGVTSAFAREWIERRCDNVIKATLEAVAGQTLEVIYSLTPVSEGDRQVEPPAPDKPAPRNRKSSRAANAKEAEELAEMHQQVCVPFDPNLTFDLFVVGKTNRLAYSAATAVAESPGTQFNPLFIHGPSGLGKTHLLHSIGQKIAAADDSLRVLLTDGETFTHCYVNAIRDKKFDVFRRYFRTVDVWLVDDLQTIASKERTREEFFHTFNAFQQTRRQIVLASDKTPRELHAMDDRLRSRLEAGLIADIEPPAVETRFAILQQFCRNHGWQVPDNLLYIIANAIQSNVRALEGAVTRLVVQASVFKCPIDLDLVQRVLTYFFIDLHGTQPKNLPSIPTIAQMVGDAYCVSLDALLSPRRDPRTALARQVTMYLARELSNESLKAIGQFLGGRDHTTVQRGVKRIEQAMQQDPELRKMVLELRGRLCS